MAEVRLVIVGHLGIGVDHTPKGTARHLGGSGYACARGASIIEPRRTGLVARVGGDFDWSALERLGVDLRGVQAVEGRSARFEIVQYADNTRTVMSQLAVADHPETWTLPADYERAERFHLATMPLHQQGTWLERLRELPSRPKVSVDMFESHAEDDPAAARRLCHAADLVFMNEEEHRILFSGHPEPDRAMVVKRGKRGATYRFRQQRIDTGAPQVETVDTTGAGEILAGALLAMMLAGYSVKASLRIATGLASVKVGEFGVDGAQLTAALRRSVRGLADAMAPFTSAGGLRPGRRV